ncbi:UNVERIFIED_CONTAM: hypothetical protein FKN15_016876 [Acipenser sinensis]
MKGLVTSLRAQTQGLPRTRVTKTWHHAAFVAHIPGIHPLPPLYIADTYSQHC